jgi:hypothetical protein
MFRRTEKHLDSGFRRNDELLPVPTGYGPGYMNELCARFSNYFACGTEIYQCKPAQIAPNLMDGSGNV